MNNYITVSEFAKRAGISKQRVYQLLNKSLKEFVQEVDGKKVIDIKGLELFKNDENNARVEQTFEQDFNKSLIDTLKTTIDVLQKQLDEKDKQINELHKLIDQQQQLHAQANVTNKLESTEDRVEREKKGFFRRMFNRQ